MRQDAGALEVLVASPGGGVDLAGIGSGVRTAVRKAGAVLPPVRVRVVDAIPAGAAGKRPLVARRADRSGPFPAGA